MNVAALVHVVAINTRWRLSLESWEFFPGTWAPTDTYSLVLNLNCCHFHGRRRPRKPQDASAPPSKSWMADNLPRPGQILNHVEPRRYPTRHSIRQSGTSLELYDTVLNDTFRKTVTLSTMSVTPDDIAKLGKRLGAMFVLIGTLWRHPKYQGFFPRLWALFKTNCNYIGLW